MNDEKGKGNRDYTFKVRMRPDERALLEKTAELSGLKMADFARQTILMKCGKKKSEIDLVKPSYDEVAQSLAAGNIRLLELGSSLESLIKVLTGKELPAHLVQHRKPVSEINQMAKEIRAEFKSINEICGEIYGLKKQGGKGSDNSKQPSDSDE